MWFDQIIISMYFHDMHLIIQSNSIILFHIKINMKIIKYSYLSLERIL